MPASRASAARSFTVTPSDYFELIAHQTLAANELTWFDIEVVE